MLPSKFGTSIHYEKDESTNAKNDKGDDSETDDETDDEGGNSMSIQGSQLTSEVQGVLQRQFPVNVTEPVKKEGSIILPSLSLVGTSKKTKYVLIQVGYSVFKVTRVPFECCVSRLSPKDKKKVEELGPLVGAHISSAFDVDNVNYLISPDRSSTGKYISAWTLNIPTISPSFISAFAERNKLTDEVPKHEDYIPAAQESDFSNNNDLAPKKRVKLFAGYKCISLIASSEIEIMCLCAGATTIRLYKTDENGKQDSKFWMTDEFFESLRKRQEEDKLALLVLDTTSKRLKKGKDFLMNKMQELEAAGVSISLVNQKAVAQTISLGVPLRDTHDNEVSPLIDIPDSQSIASRASSKSSQKKASPTVISSDADKAIEEDQRIENDHGMEEENENLAPEPTNQDTSISETETVQVTRMQQGDTEMLAPEDVEESRPKRSTKETAKSDWISGSKSKSNKSKKKQKDTGWMSTAPKPSVEELHVLQDEEENEYEETEVDSKNAVHLEKSNDGWFKAAPHGKARNKFKRKVHNEETGELFESAETETVQNLEVDKKNKTDHVQSNLGSRQTQGNSQNFKKFKKNSVIAGAGLHQIEPVRFIPVLPKESERQKELEAMQNALDQQQRLADSLFSGEESRKGIRSYFGRGRKRNQ